MEQPELNGLADFVLIASHGGLGKAARATGRSKATLSRRLSELEAVLGVRLVERGAQQLKLTAEGEMLLERTRGPLGELLQAGDDVRNGGGQLAGPLRISAPVLLSHVGLMEIVAAFSQLHPRLEIEVNAEDRFIDPIEEGYDLVIRTNPKPTEHMVGRRLFSDQLALVAVPEIASPQPPDGAEVPAVLLSRVGEVRDWQVAQAGDVITYRPRPVLRLSSILMIHAAVKAGAGAAILPLSLVGADIEAGALHSCGAVLNRPVEVWALHASQRLSSRKVTSFIDFLTERFPERRLEV